MLLPANLEVFMPGPRRKILRNDQNRFPCIMFQQLLATRFLRTHRYPCPPHPYIQQRLITTMLQNSRLLSVVHRKRVHPGVSRQFLLSLAAYQLLSRRVGSLNSMCTVGTGLQSLFSREREWHQCHEHMQRHSILASMEPSTHHQSFQKPHRVSKAFLDCISSTQNFSSALHTVHFPDILVRNQLLMSVHLL